MDYSLKREVMEIFTRFKMLLYSNGDPQLQIKDNTKILSIQRVSDDQGYRGQNDIPVLFNPFGTGTYYRQQWINNLQWQYTQVFKWSWKSYMKLRHENVW